MCLDNNGSENKTTELQLLEKRDTLSKIEFAKCYLSCPVKAKEEEREKLLPRYHDNTPISFYFEICLSNILPVAAG